MRRYTTIQGDMWDSIAYNELGSDTYAGKLMEANRQYYDYYLFPAGVELILPDINPELPSILPPWKQVQG